VNPVFSQLPYSKKGDKIEVLVGKQKFEYEVLGIQVVEPHEVGVINPPEPNGRYLSLMTCVPPGLNTKRLVVLSKMIE
jgi:sortase A